MQFIHMSSLYSCQLLRIRLGRWVDPGESHGLEEISRGYLVRSNYF